MEFDDRDDERLSRWLRAVSAEPDDRALRLALARIGAEPDAPRWLAWVMRPAALGTAALLLVFTTSISWWWLESGVDRTSLSDQVMAAADASSAPDLDSADSATPAAEGAGPAATDSGGSH